VLNLQSKELGKEGAEATAVSLKQNNSLMRMNLASTILERRVQKQLQ